MTAALVVAVLLALVFAVGWMLAEHDLGDSQEDAAFWRKRADGWEARARKNEVLLGKHDRVLADVATALGKVWRHVRPDTPEEGAAVAVLRAAFRELPVPLGIGSRIEASEPNLCEVCNGPVVVSAVHGEGVCEMALEEERLK